MLRLLVLALLLLNGLYFVWSQGLLRVFDFAPAQQSEPQRLEQQVHPEALHVLTPQEQQQAEAVTKVPARAPVCLQAGLFDDAQSTALRVALEGALPKDTWVFEAVVEPERWIVYMGKFANAEALVKKRTELASLELNFEPLTNAALEPGLSLGGFETQAQADAALEALTQRGVRTARVVQEHAEVRGTVLRLPAADEALRAQLEGLGSVLAGKSLRRCR